MGRAKRNGGPLVRGVVSPSAGGVRGPLLPALCIASADCPLARPARRIPLGGKKQEVWTDGYPDRGAHFDASGSMISCRCKNHEGVQVR